MSGRNHLKPRGYTFTVVLFCILQLPLSILSAENRLPQKVIVKKGETLSAIVIQETGSSDPALWKLVAEFNNRSVEQTLEIGDVILLPADLLKPQVLLEESPVLQADAGVARVEAEVPPAQSPKPEVLLEESVDSKNTSKMVSRSLQPTKAPLASTEVQFSESTVKVEEQSSDAKSTDSSSSSPNTSESTESQADTSGSRVSTENTGSEVVKNEEAKQPRAAQQQVEWEVQDPASDTPLAVVEDMDQQPDNVQSCEGQQVCFDVSSSTREKSTIVEEPQEEAQSVEVKVTDKNGQNADVEVAAPPVANKKNDQPEITSETPPNSNTTVATAKKSQRPAQADVQTPPNDRTEKPLSNTVNTNGLQAQAEPAPPKPGMFEVDEDAAVRALERSLIQLNALLLSPRRAEATVSYDYSYNADAEPVTVSVEDPEAGTTDDQVGQLQSEVENSTITLDLKFGLPYDSQINVSLPISFIDQEVAVVAQGGQSGDQGSTANGAGDFSITFDKTLAVEKGARPDIIASATYDSDSGAGGVGSNATELSLGIRATKRQDPLVFTAGLSQTFSQKTDDGFKAGDVTQLSIGTLLAASPYTSLQFLFNQAIIGGAQLNGQPLPNSDGNIANFSAGVSSVVGEDTFFSAQLSMGLVDRASDYRLSFALAKQFSF